MATPMEVDSGLAAMTDENYLNYKAQTLLKTDQSSAKAWLITARTLFPRNFNYQFEAYKLEKNCRNVAAAARMLEELFRNFPSERVLWSEASAISEALQADSSEANSKFLADLFANLPSELQCHLLLGMANTTRDVLQQCRLTLLVLQRYPKHVGECGVKMIESLIKAEKEMQYSPFNCYRKYLACDVLPVVLQHVLPGVMNKQHLYWLQKAMEFFVNYVTKKTDSDLASVAAMTDSSSPTKKASVAAPFVIPNLSEKDSAIESPWQLLYDLLSLFGNQLGWEQGHLFGNNSNRECQWKFVSELHRAYGQRQEKSRLALKQLLYCTLLLFLDSVHSYSRRVQPGLSASHHHPLVLIEDFSSLGRVKQSPPKSKKARLVEDPPLIEMSSSVPDSALLVPNFTTALKCWELLQQPHSPCIKDFSKLSTQWDMEHWQWMRCFQVDLLIYQGAFKEAIRHLLKLQTSQRLLRWDLQMACCYYSLGNYSKACDSLLNIIHALPGGSKPAAEESKPVGSSRHLVFLQCSEAEILPFCIQLLLTCFKEKAFRVGSQDDLSLGHMLVLTQFDWPKHQELFSDAVLRIQQQGTFTYNLFFTYIVNVDMLEEFSFIRKAEGGKVNLDILPMSVKSLAQSRTVTRGVNKGVKEDFRATMEKQVARSDENVEQLIRTFLTEEKELLQQNLS